MICTRASCRLEWLPSVEQPQYCPVCGEPLTERAREIKREHAAMNTHPLVNCESCGLAYPPRDMSVLVFLDGDREPTCPHCLHYVRAGLEAIEPYVRSVLEGQMELPQALAGTDDLGRPQ